MPFINMAMRDDAEARAVTVGAMVSLLRDKINDIS